MLSPFVVVIDATVGRNIMIVYNNQQQKTRLCSFWEDFGVLLSPLEKNNSNHGQQAIIMRTVFSVQFDPTDHEEEYHPQSRPFFQVRTTKIWSVLCHTHSPLTYAWSA